MPTGFAWPSLASHTSTKFATMHGSAMSRAIALSYIRGFA